MEKETVNHPAHYSDGSGVECIEIIRNLPLALGNAIKYLWRAGRKNDQQEDFKKALWYLEDYLKHNVCCGQPLQNVPQHILLKWAYGTERCVQHSVIVRILEGNLDEAEDILRRLIDNA